MTVRVGLKKKRVISNTVTKRLVKAYLKERKKEKKKQRERREEVRLVGPIHIERQREREIRRHGIDNDYLWSSPTRQLARSSTGEGQRAVGRG